MGLLKSIKKGAKKIFKGVKKVFKKVGAFIGKIAGSKWGKRLLLAAAIFTGGMALMAGIGSGMATTGSFLAKFTAGAKGFMAGLTSPIATAKGAVAGAQAGGGITGALTGAAQGSGALAQAGVAGVGQAAAQPPMQAAANPQLTAETAAAAGQNAGLPATVSPPMAPPPGSGGNMLEAAKGMGRGALELAKSTGGGLILSNAVQGYAAGKAQEDYLKKGGYVDRQWAQEGNQAMVDEASANSAGIISGYAQRRARVQDPSSRGSYTGYARDPRRGG